MQIGETFKAEMGRLGEGGGLKISKNEETSFMDDPLECDSRFSSQFHLKKHVESVHKGNDYSYYLENHHKVPIMYGRRGSILPINELDFFKKGTWGSCFNSSALDSVLQ